MENRNHNLALRAACRENAPASAASRFIAVILGFAVLSQSAVAEGPSTPPVSCNRLYASTIGPTEEELNLLVEKKGNLFVVPKRTVKETKELNDLTLKKLREEKMPDAPGSKRVTGLGKNEIKSLYRDAMANPQIKESLCGSYNGSRSVGFCWGRAFGVHMLAMNLTNLNNKSVRKLWAVGDLKNGRTKWRYHVTTIVRETDGGWYAIDPIFEKPMPVEEWYQTMRSDFDPSHTMRIFSSPASRFAPDEWKKYSKKHISSAAYYNFFADFMNAVYTENTGRIGPWRNIAAGNIPAIRMNKFKRLMEKVGVAGVAAAYGYGGYRVAKEFWPKKSSDKKSEPQKEKPPALKLAVPQKE